MTAACVAGWSKLAAAHDERTQLRVRLGERKTQ